MSENQRICEACRGYRTADLVTFTEEIFNRKFHFLYSVVVMTLPNIRDGVFPKNT